MLQDTDTLSLTFWSHLMHSSVENTVTTPVELEPLPSVDRTRLLQHRLIQFIRGNGLRPGEKLPSENQLARGLGVGRPALREALRSLQALGLLEVRAGSGWYAANPSLDAVAKHLVFTLEPSRRTRNELQRIRGLLEGAFLEKAMEELTEEDFGRLRRLVAKMEMLAMAGQSYLEQDRDFHLTLFSHVDNDFFHRFIEACWTVSMSWTSILEPATRDRELRKANKHRTILNAVAAGDVDTARTLLEVHSISDPETPGYSDEC